MRAGAGDADDVLVITTVSAPRRGRRKRGKHARLTGSDPDPHELPATRATAVRADPFAGEAEAEAWLARITRDPEARDDFVAEALVLVNSALHAQRAATMDPSVNDLGAHDPVATRVGWGDGEELAAGKWTKAVDAPPDPGKRVRRAEALRPQERLAAVLGGRGEVGACETLVLRARLDVDAGRRREAALQLEPAVRALLAEVGPGAPEDQLEDLGEIRARAVELGQIAERALAGPLDPAASEAVAEVLELCERVLRRRRILGQI
ncbi:MAG TPA: hypothetical protein VFY99_00455 [Solirubrobacterales bacterium]